MVTSGTRQIGFLVDEAYNGSSFPSNRILLANGRHFRRFSSFLELFRTSFSCRVTNRLTQDQFSGVVTVTTRGIRIVLNEEVDGRVRIRNQDRGRQDLRQ